MRPINWMLVGAATTFLLVSWTTRVDLASSAPRLERVQSLSTVAVRLDRQTETRSTLYFTMTLPEPSEPGFTMLSFTEQYRDQGAELLQFDFSDPIAFVGTPETVAQPLTVAAWMDETGTFWAEFDRALPAATTLTVAFQVQTPPTTGAYEYGIAAYPAISTPVAVFVGNGTLTIR